jgi:hypothetical protein
MHKKSISLCEEKLQEEINIAEYVIKKNYVLLSGIIMRFNFIKKQDMLSYS